MKRLLGLFLLAGAVVACSKSDDLPTNDIPAGMGTVAFAVTPQTAITTRATVDLEDLGVTLPTASDMVLTITPPEGGYDDSAATPFSYTGTVGEYNGPENRDAKKRYLPASNQPYKATLVWPSATEGSTPATEEGIGKAYFESRNADGGKEQGFIVTARTSQSVSMKAKMIKAIVRINFTDEFMGYFGNGAEMTLRTAAGNEFKVGYTADGTKSNIGTPFFIVAGADKSFTITGKATKQRPTANIEPQTVTFTPVGRDGSAGNEVAEQTMYTYTFDVVDANNVTVTIDINNEPVGEEVVGTEELNDDAVM